MPAEDLFKSIRDAYKDRIRNPAIGGYALGWIAWNLVPIIRILFRSEGESVRYILTVNPFEYLPPVYIALLYVGIGPVLSVPIAWYESLTNRWQRYARYSNERASIAEEKDVEDSRERVLRQREANDRHEGKLDEVKADINRLSGEKTRLKLEVDKLREVHAGDAWASHFAGSPRKFEAQVTGMVRSIVEERILNSETKGRVYSPSSDPERYSEWYGNILQNSLGMCAYERVGVSASEVEDVISKYIDNSLASFQEQVDDILTRTAGDLSEDDRSLVGGDSGETSQKDDDAEGANALIGYSGVSHIWDDQFHRNIFGEPMGGFLHESHDFYDGHSLSVTPWGVREYMSKAHTDLSKLFSVMSQKAKGHNVFTKAISEMQRELLVPVTAVRTGLKSHGVQYYNSITCLVRELISRGYLVNAESKLLVEVNQEVESADWVLGMYRICGVFDLDAGKVLLDEAGDRANNGAQVYFEMKAKFKDKRSEFNQGFDVERLRDIKGFLEYIKSVQ